MRTVYTAIVWTLLGTVSAFTYAAEPEILWQIGTKDHQYKELAFTGDVGSYAQKFAKDVTFTVGTSDPAKDFSGIHPGPADGWAGGRVHPFVILFDLVEEPAGAYELKLELVDTHAEMPPTLNVRLNDAAVEIKLERGKGDFSLLRPEQGKAQTVRFCFGPQALKKVGNRLEITNVAGSWLLYDAITLGHMPKGQIDLHAATTIFLVEKNGKLKQEVRVSAGGILSDGPVRIEAKTDGQSLGTFELGKPSLGIASGDIHLDETTQPREVTLSVAAGELKAETKIQQTPVKKWRIYVAPAAHTDIGYTDRQENVIDRHNRNTDLAMEMCREFPLYHWNLESSWAAQIWFEDRPAGRHEELLEAARQRRVGIEASYLNMLTGLCTEEELIRQMYYSARLNRQYGVPFESYTLTDAPSHVWSVPSIIAGAGLRCLSVGVNGARAPLFKKNIQHKSPFWWEGPDGQKVLTWFAEGYAQASRIGLSEGLDRMRKAVEGDLAWWNSRKDYPYDAILLHGAYGDNCAIARNMGVTLTEFSQKYAYPKVILCANNQFFEYIEKNFADKIPTVRGCGGSWWEDGAASTAWETAVCRRVHQDIITAEAVWAALQRVDTKTVIPQDRFNTVWDKILLYDEHTWGAWNSIEEPNIDFVHRQWAYKAAYATDAATLTKRLIRDGLEQLAARVKTDDGSLLVFNPTGSPRTGRVETELLNDMVIRDDAGIVPHQVVQPDEKISVVAFVAKDVPAVGYRVYKIEKAAPAKAENPKRFDGKVLENEYYRITLDAPTGAIAGIFDKKLNKELVDQKSPYKFAQLVYGAGGEAKKGKTMWEMDWNAPDPKKVQFSSPKDGAIKAVSAGPLFTDVQMTAAHEQFRSCEMHPVLYENERRIDIVVRMNKKLVFEKEAVYVAFPFAGANPKFRFEIGGGNVRPNEDHFPGACRDWFAVQRWVSVNTDDAGVALSPIDSPLITLCEPSAGKWADEAALTNGTVFAYVMNNYWWTNYKAGQDGECVFRFSLTSDKTMDTATASRFGESAQVAMRAIRVPPKRPTPDQPVSAGFCRVEPESAMLTAIKPADDGKGYIVRIRETAGQATDATVTLFSETAKATACDLVERNKEPLPVQNGKVTVKLRANGMATIRVE